MTPALSGFLLGLVLGAGLALAALAVAAVSRTEDDE